MNAPGVSQVWPEHNLGELCNLRREFVEPSADGRNRYVGLEHIDTGTTRIQRWGDDGTLRSTKSRFYKGDVLYGKLRPYLDKAALAEWEGVCSTDVLVLEPRPQEADPAYLAFLLHTPDLLAHAVSTTSGVNHPRTSWAGLASFRYPVPPLPQQQGISAVLSKIQAAAEAQDKIVTTLKELKAVTMAKLFTHGLRGEQRHDTELGPLPKTWSAVRLGSFGRIGNGSTPLKSNAAYWTDGSIPWLTSAKVYDVTIKKADQFVTPAAADECHLPRVKPGSVLIAITGQGKTLGHAAVTAIETCVSQHIAFLVFEDDSANPHFIRLLLESRYAELRAVALGGGSTKGALTCGFLKTFFVPKPERREQDEIASALMMIEAKISVHERKRAALQDLFETLLHLLMTGQVRMARLGHRMGTV